MGCTQACNNNRNGPQGIVDIVFFSFRVVGGGSVSLLHEVHYVFDVCSHLRSQCPFWKIGEDLLFNWSLKVDRKILI